MVIDGVLVWLDHVNRECSTIMLWFTHVSTEASRFTCSWRVICSRSKEHPHLLFCKNKKTEVPEVIEELIVDVQHLFLIFILLVKQVFHFLSGSSFYSSDFFLLLLSVAVIGLLCAVVIVCAFSIAEDMHANMFWCTFSLTVSINWVVGIVIHQHGNTFLFWHGHLFLWSPNVSPR